MFEYLFPIFAFGVVVSAVIVKGVLNAAEIARKERLADHVPASDTHPAGVQPLFPAASRAVTQTL